MPNPLDSILNFDPSKPSQGGGIPGQPHPSAGGKPLPGVKTSPSNVGGGDFLSSVTGFQPTQATQTQQQPTIKKPEDKLSYKAGKFIAKTATNLADLTVSSVDFLIDSTIEYAKKYPTVGEGNAKTKAKALEWAQYYQDKISPKYGPDRAKKALDAIQAHPAMQPSKEWQQASVKDKLLKHPQETMFELGPSIIASMGPYFVNPVLGFTMSAASTADDIKTVAVKNGMSDGQATIVGGGTGLVIGAIDKAGFSSLIPKPAQANAKRAIGTAIVDFVSQVLKGGGEEALTELTQESIQIAVETAVGEEFSGDEILQRAVLSAVGGFMGGTGTSFIYNAANAIAKEAKQQQNYDVEIPVQRDEVKASTTTPKKEEKPITTAPSVINQPVPTQGITATVSPIVEPITSSTTTPSVVNQPVPSTVTTKPKPETKTTTKPITPSVINQPAPMAAQPKGNVDITTMIPQETKPQEVVISEDQVDEIVDKVEAVLPQQLSGAKPRYNIGKVSYTPTFESDIDKALFIVSQKTPSKRDADYREFLKSTGLSDAQIAVGGKRVRDSIKSIAMSTKTGGEIIIPRTFDTDAMVINATKPSEELPEKLDKKPKEAKTKKKETKTIVKKGGKPLAIERVTAIITKGMGKSVAQATVVNGNIHIPNKDFSFQLTLKSDLEDGNYNAQNGEFLKTKADEKFPPLSWMSVKGEKKKIAKVSTSVLKDAISRAARYTSDTAPQEQLQNIHIASFGDKARVVASDSYQGIVLGFDFDSNGDMLLEITNPELLSKSVDLLGDSVDIEYSETGLFLFKGENGSIVVKGNNSTDFITRIQSVLSPVTKQYSLNRVALLEKIKSLKPIFKTTGTNQIQIMYNPDNTMSVTAVSRDGLNQRTEVIDMTPRTIYHQPMVKSTEDFGIIMPIKEGDGTDGVYVFNAEYLLNSLETLESGEIAMQTRNDDSFSALNISSEIQEEIDPMQKEIATKGGKGSMLSKASTALANFQKRVIKTGNEVDFKLHEKVLEIIHKYAQRVTEGNVPSNALGVFWTKSQNIGVRSLTDIAVVAHEVTHFLDQSYNVISDVIAGEKRTSKTRAELKKIYLEYYAGAKPFHKLELQLREGYATLVERYLVEPETITVKYPWLVSEFLKNGGTYFKPVIGDMMNDLDKVVAEYQDLSALDKVGAVIARKKSEVKNKKLLNLRERIRQFVADEIFSVEKIDQMTGKNWTTNAIGLSLHAYKAAGNISVHNISTKRKSVTVGDKELTFKDGGYWAMRNGAPTKVLGYNFSDLIFDLEEQGLIDQFDNFLIARNQYELREELKEMESELEVIDELAGAEEKMKLKEQINDLRSRLDKDGFDEKTIVDAYNEGKEKLLGYAEKFNELTNAQLDTLADPEVQLLDSETQAKLKSRKGYAAQKRQFFSDILGDQTSFTSIKSGKNKISSLRKAFGSNKVIISPLYSALQSEFEINKKSHKQIVYNLLAKTAVQDADVLADWLQVVPLETHVDADGVVTFPQEKDPDIIMGRHNGKRVAILLDAELKQVFDSTLNSNNFDGFKKLLIGAARLKTMGTTGLEPTFAAANIIIDNLSALAQTRNELVPLVSAFKNLTTAISDSDSDEAKYFNEYVISASINQTMRGFYEMSPEQAFATITNEMNVIAKTVEKGLDFMSAPSQLSEISTRATEYILARKAGKSYRVALEEAARVTGAFSHMGAWGGSEAMKTWVKSIAYTNSLIQVLDGSMRNIEDTKQRKRFVLTSAAIIASMVGTYSLTLAFTDDDDKDKLLNLSPKEMAGFLFMPSSEGKLVKIKVPDNIGWVASLINMTLANRVRQGNYDFNDFIDGATSYFPDQIKVWDFMQMMLSYIPDIGAPMIEVALNKKTYPEIRPLESEKQLNIPKELRQTPSTSKTAKIISKLWTKISKENSLSPIQIDHLVSGYMGTASKYFMFKPNAFDPTQRFQYEYHFEYSRKLNDFYDMKESNGQDYKAYKDELKEFSDEEIDKILTRREIISEVDGLLKQYKELDPKDSNAKVMANEITAIIMNLE